MPEQREQRSEEVQEILGQIPKWIVRWGITLISVSLILIILASWFFKYPDVIVAPVEITTSNPPAEILAHTHGKIEQLWVKNQQRVKQNQILALINSPLNFTDYTLLKAKLDSFSFHLNDSVCIDLPQQLELGQLQNVYIAFVNAYSGWRYFIEQEYYQQKIEALAKQIDKYDEYYKRLQREKILRRSDVVIAQKQIDRDKVLCEKEVISKAELERSETALLNKKVEYEKAKSKLASAQFELEAYRKELLDLQLDWENQSKQYRLSLDESLNKLKSELKLYEYQYILKAACDGKINFTKVWSINQNVKENEKVFTIVPEDSSSMIGRIQLPIRGSGKVAVGQKVNIKLDNYPYMEYGLVRARVKAISMLPEDNNLLVEVSFPNNLVTNYNRNLEFMQGLSGKAEIITVEERLIQKLFNPIKALFERQKGL